jgi:hypothetical protein
VLPLERHKAVRTWHPKIEDDDSCFDRASCALNATSFVLHVQERDLVDAQLYKTLEMAKQGLGLSVSSFVDITLCCAHLRKVSAIEARERD